MRQPATSELISVIIPLMNEEDGIALLAEKLCRLGQLFGDRTKFEFIFVDDGSTDNTAERLRVAYSGQKNVRVLAHAKNRGVGAAFRTGFADASGSIVCTIDADCSYAPEGLKSLVEALERAGADIAVASPYHPEGSVQDIVPWRIFISRVCSAMYRAISPVPLYTYTSIFRAYRQPVIRNVSFSADGFVSASEILIRAAEMGFRVTEVPMTLHGRKVGLTKMKILRTIGRHLSLMGTLVLARFRRNRVQASPEAARIGVPIKDPENV